MLATTAEVDEIRKEAKNRVEDMRHVTLAHGTFRLDGTPCGYLAFELSPAAECGEHCQ